MYTSSVPNRLLFNFIIDPEMKAAMESIKERDGISVSEQARRALAAWIESKEIRLKGGNKKKKR